MVTSIVKYFKQNFRKYVFETMTKDKKFVQKYFMVYFPERL